MKADLKRRFEAGFQGLANLMLQHKAAGEQLVPTGTGSGGALIGSMPLPSRKSGVSGWPRILPGHMCDDEARLSRGSAVSL
jgi:hypothetical protein